MAEVISQDDEVFERKNKYNVSKDIQMGVPRALAEELWGTTITDEQYELDLKWYRRNMIIDMRKRLKFANPTKELTQQFETLRMEARNDNTSLRDRMKKE